MMTKKQFIKSQEECASMLGMSLDEYQNYCKNLKVSNEKNVSVKRNGNTKSVLNFLGISEILLKIVLSVIL